MWFVADRLGDNNGQGSVQLWRDPPAWSAQALKPATDPDAGAAAMDAPATGVAPVGPHQNRQKARLPPLSEGRQALSGLKCR